MVGGFFASRSARTVRIGACLGLLAASCSRFGPVYPPRPTPSEGQAAADPQPARVVAHVTVTSAALRQALDDAAPRTGDGTVRFLGSDRPYTWERGPLEVGFSQGRVVLKTTVLAKLTVPLKTLELPLELRVEAEPILSSEYAVKLQSVDVQVRSSDTGIAVADRIAGIYDRIAAPIAARLKDFGYDLRPLVSEAYERVARPIDLPIGDARGKCAAPGPRGRGRNSSVLADGIEKDIALVVAPSVTLPCAEPTGDLRATLPPLSNVAAVMSGPFTVTIPIAARYDELTRAMSMAFTDGKLFFSTEYLGLYLEKPGDLLASPQGQLCPQAPPPRSGPRPRDRHRPRRRAVPSSGTPPSSTTSSPFPISSPPSRPAASSCHSRR